MIQEVASKLHKEDTSLASKIMYAEWCEMVRIALGKALVIINLNEAIDQNVEKVLNEVRFCKNNVASHGKREHVFGCTLFGNPAIESFSIGPCKFEPRLEWLVRHSSEGAVSKITRRRIENAWSKRKICKLKLSTNSHYEKKILDTVGTCPFVCSVTIDGLAPEAAHQKALTAVRLALTAMALLWRNPSSALDGMNLPYDRPIHFRQTLTIVPGEAVLQRSSMSRRPHGPWLEVDEWETMLDQRSDYFAYIGEILHYVIDPARGDSRSKMLDTLTQALLWFHEGCRESVALMGVVNFAATLDTLACGRGPGGIINLIKARLNLQPTDPIKPDGTTVKSAIKKIYGKGRSRTLHGTNPDFGHDWSDTKSLSEQLALHCLLACIKWAGENPESNDPKQLSADNPK